MSNPAFQGRPSSAFQRFVTLSMRNAIDTFGRKYTRWGAVCPGTFIPVLTFEGKCSCWRAKPAHFVGYLPVSSMLGSALTQRPHPQYSHVRKLTISNGIQISPHSRSYSAASSSPFVSDAEPGGEPGQEYDCQRCSCHWYQAEGLDSQKDGQSKQRDEQRVEKHPRQSQPQRFLFGRRRRHRYVVKIVW
jgi:hypothetical protein